MKANSFRPEITLLKYSLWGACITYQNTEKKIRAGWVSELLIDLFQLDSGRHPARFSSKICILPSWIQLCSSLCKINGWLCHVDLLYHCYILFIHIRFHKLHCFNRNFKLQCNDAKWRNWRSLQYIRRSILCKNITTTAIERNLTQHFISHALVQDVVYHH